MMCFSPQQIRAAVPAADLTLLTSRSNAVCWCQVAQAAEQRDEANAELAVAEEERKEAEISTVLALRSFSGALGLASGWRWVCLMAPRPTQGRPNANPTPTVVETPAPVAAI